MLDYKALTDCVRDRKLTLSQNYQRLGLSSRLGGRSGGVEKTGKENESTKTVDSLAIPAARKTGKLLPEEVRVERDPETGNILRVIRPDQDQAVPNHYTTLSTTSKSTRQRRRSQQSMASLLISRERLPKRTNE